MDQMEARKELRRLQNAYGHTFTSVITIEVGKIWEQATNRQINDYSDTIAAIKLVMGVEQ